MLTASVMVYATFSHAQVTQHYTETPLTSNLASLAPLRDGNLVNAWGLSRSSKGAWWVSDNGAGLSTLYDGTGAIQSLVVAVPPGGPNNGQGTPTGTVFNGDSASFQIAPGKPALFLFATEDGTISGWNPGVSTSAVVVVNNKQAVYKGMTIATATLDNKPQILLYVADFHRGRVAVFDATFKPITLPRIASAKARDERGEGGEREAPFTDERLPENYAPFNVQNIGGNIYVAFAQQDNARHDEVDGSGKGFVDVFSPTGELLMRLQHGAFMNAPWGLALASNDFGAFSHDVLVGQFGSGQILAFDPVSGIYKGTLNGANNQPLVIDGLWALAFGNGASAGPANSLYFTAGVDHEQNGLFGVINAVENPQGNDQ
jgi:uncharacterized protein (TIGR03118 family)